MKNFKTLLKQEFLRHIHSFKFSLMLIVSVIVTVICVYVQIKDFEDRQQNYFEEVNRAEELKKSFRVFSEFQIPILIKPNPLSIFAKGYDEKIGNKIVIAVTELPEFQTTSQKRNPFLDIFLNFDIVSIVQIILSIMTIFLVAGTISGEREEETLKFIFANHVSRFEYFFSRFIASLFILSIPLVSIFLATSLMIVLQPFILLSGMFWLKVFFIFICCLGFLSIYILIGLIVSTKTSISSLSVIYGLLIWIIIAFIYPNTINFVINETVNIPSTDELNAQIEQASNELSDKLWANFHWPNRRVDYSLQRGYNWGLPNLTGVTQKYVFEAHENAVKTNIPLLFEGQQKLLSIHDDFRHRLIKQKIRASYFLKILPSFLLEESTTKIANTDFQCRDFTIRSKARNFRNVVIDYLQSKDAFGLKLFTQMKREEMKDNYDEYSKEIFVKYSNEDTYPRLNLQDIPAFSYSEKFILPLEIVFILIMNLVLFVIGGQLFSTSNLIKRG